jgi:hypothetical protein
VSRQQTTKYSIKSRLWPFWPHQQETKEKHDPGNRRNNKSSAPTDNYRPTQTTKLQHRMGPSKRMEIKKKIATKKKKTFTHKKIKINYWQNKKWWSPSPKRAKGDQNKHIINQSITWNQNFSFSKFFELLIYIHHGYKAFRRRLQKMSNLEQLFSTGIILFTKNKVELMTSNQFSQEIWRSRRKWAWVS